MAQTDISVVTLLNSQWELQPVNWGQTVAGVITGSQGGGHQGAALSYQKQGGHDDPTALQSQSSKPDGLICRNQWHWLGDHGIPQK